MVIRKRENGNFGFTLTEVLVVFGIIVVLAGLATTILLKVRTSAKSVVCLSNLKQIAAAIQMYHSDYKATPDRIYPLLENSGYITTAGTFKCPADLTSDPDSYGPFYLPRSLTDSQKLFLGCPRHADKAIALFGWPQFNVARACKVLWNGAPVSQGTVVNGGELLFEDGTRVVINGALPVGVMLSTMDQNKQIYSGISVRDGDLGNGSLTVTHPAGFPSQFEVLTPSLITGVAGTVFTATFQWPDTSNPTQSKTTIVCTEGKVMAEERTGGKITPIEVKDGPKSFYNPIRPKAATSDTNSPGHSHWRSKWWKS